MPLRLSHGDLRTLDEAITLGRTDWRDLLVAAMFADDIHAHEQWVPQRLTPDLMDRWHRRHLEGVQFRVGSQVQVRRVALVGGSGVVESLEQLEPEPAYTIRFESGRQLAVRQRRPAGCWLTARCRGRRLRAAAERVIVGRTNGASEPRHFTTVACKSSAARWFVSGSGAARLEAHRSKRRGCNYSGGSGRSISSHPRPRRAPRDQHDPGHPAEAMTLRKYALPSPPSADILEKYTQMVLATLTKQGVSQRVASQRISTCALSHLPCAKLVVDGPPPATAGPRSTTWFATWPA